MRNDGMSGERRVFFPVTPSEEKIRKMPDLFTANPIQGSSKKPGGFLLVTAN
jgi:hypothetical protein